MPNSNYDQVTDLLAQGKLNWVSDSIVALLTTDAVFTADQKKFSEVGAKFVTSAPIQGRWVADGGRAMGLPAVFLKVTADTDYQVIIAQDIGVGDPILLAFVNADMDDSSLSVQRSGTMIVRPVQEEATPPAGMTPPPTTGVWMTF